MADQKLSEYGRKGAQARWGNRPIPERFWEKVDIRPEPGVCWIWKHPTRMRYPHFQYPNEPRMANRVAYELTYGPIPAGLCVMHICDNTKCCNPNHLQLGTHHENMLDASRKQRWHFNYAVKRKGSKRWLGVFGDANPNTHHPDARVKEVCNMHAAGHTAKEIAAKLELSWHVVRNLLYVRSKHIS